MKKVISALILCIFFLFLLISPKDAVKSASEGLNLWLNTLVPTLLPVMILSNLMVMTGLSALLALPFYPLCSRVFGIGVHGTYALISGFLCGFPMGAKIISDLYHKNCISKEEAHYLCPFCNNVSPAFTLNYLISQHMSLVHHSLPVFLLLYLSPLVYGFITSIIFRKKNLMIQKPVNKASFTAPNFAMIDACITNGIHSITKLGGYVILFSVLAAILNFILSSVPFIRAPVIALTEITTGIHMIASMPLPSDITYTLLVICTAFGGLCTAAQSQSMLHSIGMPIQKYLSSRVCIAAIAAILSICYFF